MDFETKVASMRGRILIDIKNLKQNSCLEFLFDDGHIVEFNAFPADRHETYESDKFWIEPDILMDLPCLLSDFKKGGGVKVPYCPGSKTGRTIEPGQHSGINTYSLYTGKPFPSMFFKVRSFSRNVVLGILR